MPEQNIKTRLESLRQSSLSNNQIVDSLKKEGYSSKDIYNILSAEDMKPASFQTDDLEPPSPSEEIESSIQPEQSYMERIPKTIPQLPPRQSIEQLEELAESIVEEKWQETSSEIESFSLWKEKTTLEIEAIKQEILRLRNNFETLQASVIGKVSEYSKNISNLNVEVKALSKVLEKILEPLTENVKELSRITETLKK